MTDSNLDLVLSGNLDQSVPLKGAEDVFKRIDTIMEKAISEHDGWWAIDQCNELYVVARLSSISLAKFLYEIVTNWHQFNIKEDVYAVLHDRIGVHKYTVQRYAEFWATLPQIPDEYRADILNHGIADASKVTKMLNAGYLPNDEQWEAIANAPDRMAFRDEIREVTQKEPSVNAINIQMEIDGNVWAYHKGEKHYVGKLDTASGVYAVQKAIYRMCIGGGVSRK